MYNSHRLAKLCISSPFSLQSEPLHLAKLTPKNSVGSRFHGDSWITTFTCFGLQTSRFFPENFTYRMQISRLFLKKWCSFVSTVLIFKKSNFHLLQWASNGIVKKLKGFFQNVKLLRLRKL